MLLEETNKNQKQQRKIDSLLRMRDFLDANADQVGALDDSEARKQLDDAVTALEAHGTDQAATDLALAGRDTIGWRRLPSLDKVQRRG